MISSLEGYLRYKTYNYIIIELNGLSFQVYISKHTYHALPDIHTKIKLNTQLLIRKENFMPTIYGFIEEEEKELFNKFLSVRGIGAKLAMNILSAIETKKLKTMIEEGDIENLSKEGGISKKVAQQLILELKGKLQKDSINKKYKILLEDTVSGLMRLGYKKEEVECIVSKLLKDNKDTNINIEELIKESLKQLSFTR